MDPGAMSPEKRSKSSLCRIECSLWLMRERKVSVSAAEAERRSAISNCGR